MGVNGEVKADISVAPQKSQIFVTICIIGAMGCLAAGFLFVWYEKQRWELPFFAAGACGLVAFIAWCMSHKNVDMSEGQATKISVSATEMSVVIDPRTVVPQNLMQQFAVFFSAVSHRAKLPPPSGLIDNSGRILPDSAQDAEVAVERANALAEKQTAELASLFGPVSTIPIPAGDAQNPDFSKEPKVSNP